MNEILITGGVGILTSIISSWCTWYFTRKKYNTEVDGNIIENLEKSLQFYKTLVDDNKARLEKVLEDDKSMREEMDGIIKENKTLKNSLAALTQENKELKKMVNELKKQVNDLSAFVNSNSNIENNEKSKSRKTVRKSSSSH